MSNLPKKSKPKSRFSRFVAGMQTQSQKRGSSLMVETGFPTSLIDLFVKNRDRLNKKKKMKKTQMKNPEPALSSSHTKPCNGEVVKAVEMVKNDENCDVFLERGDRVKNVFVHVLKMFVIVVFGLSTRRLVVGITLSAFLLVFFESCCVVKSRLIGLFRCGGNDNVNDSIGNVLNGVELTPRVEEDPARLSDCSSGIGEGIIKEMIEEDGAEFCKEKKKAKKFIKKIVKRLKTVKKKKKKGKEVDVKGDEFIENDGGGRFSISSQEQEGCEGKDQSEIFSSGELLCGSDAEISIHEENKGKGRESKSGYLIIFLVVLAGLLGGRIMGLAITIAWCVMLKIVCKLRGHENEPVRTSIRNSS